MQRSHPLVAVLAETLLGRTLSADDHDDNGDAAVGDPSILGRAGCWISEGVRARATVVLLRLRHQLLSRRRESLMVEEATALAWTAPRTAAPIVRTRGAGSARTPARRRSSTARSRAGSCPRRRRASRARGGHRGLLGRARASALLADHSRVREASRATGSTAVQAVPRPDVIGVYILLPKVA